LISSPTQISTSVGVDQCIRVSVSFTFSNLDCMTPERKTRRRVYGSDLGPEWQTEFAALGKGLYPVDAPLAGSKLAPILPQQIRITSRDFH
jgi:hypothetical protein